MKKQGLFRLIAPFFCVLPLSAVCMPVYADPGGGAERFGFIEKFLHVNPISKGTLIAIIAFVVLVFAAAIILAATGSSRGSDDRIFESAALPELEDMDACRKLDPDFNASELEAAISDLYLRLQQSWQEKNIESLRPRFTDAYFSKLNEQLDAYRKNGVTTFIDRPKVLRVTLEGFRRENGEDQIYATVQTRLVEYTVEDHTANLISGSRSEEKLMTSRWLLTRPAEPDPAGAEDGSPRCPHCGAPLTDAESDVCPCCDSTLTTEKPEFVVARIDTIAQETI